MVGRLLAEKLGLQLLAQPIPGFVGTHSEVAGAVINGDKCHLAGADPLPNWPDLGAIAGKRLELGPGFVHYRYFLNDRDKIREWLWQVPRLSVDPEDVLVNVRLGDFLPGRASPLGLVLHQSYYLYLLERLKFKRLYLMTDDPGDHPYLKHFSRFSPVLIKGSGAEHFFTALAFKRIIMSNSTFCWWFSFLSRAAEIYLPMVNGARCGSWGVGQLPGVDLRLDLPEVTHVYNVANWGAGPCRGPTDQERQELVAFHKNSKIVFLT